MRAFARLAVATLLLSASTVEAADSRSEVDAAQVLFEDGKAAIRAGKLEEGCAKLVASHKLDPSGGTVLHAADCHEKLGRLGTAWSEYGEALTLAVRDKRTDREAVARAKITELGPRIGTLTVVVAAQARSVDSYRLTLDGNALPPSAWNTPLPVDAGKHLIEASAEGRVAARREVDAVDGSAARIDAPLLVAIEPAKVVAPAPSAEPTHKLSGQRIAAIAVASSGLLGVGIGAAFGIRAMAIGDQSGSTGCIDASPREQCPQAAANDQSSARSSGTISTVAFVAGSALLAGGAVLWWTAPRQRLQVAVGHQAVWFKGEF